MTVILIKVIGALLRVLSAAHKADELVLSRYIPSRYDGMGFSQGAVIAWFPVEAHLLQAGLVLLTGLSSSR